MNRRDLLTALAAGLLWPQGRPRRRRPRAGPPWTFRLDRAYRWSLAARDGPAIVTGAEVRTTLAGGTATALAALEEVRRFQLADPLGGNAGWQVVGTLAGVEVSTRFLDGPPPLITVTARGLGEERRLEEVQFFDTAAARIPALGGGATAWINGYRSSDACALARLDQAADVTGHWQLAVLPGATSQPLALAFGVDDAGEGAFTCSPDRVVATSRFAGRPVGAQLPPAAATLAIVPAADPLDALARLAPARMLAATPGSEVPTGWIFRPGPGGNAAESDFLANLEAARAALDPTRSQIALLDDGYQRAAGDWQTNDSFPHGHRWLTDRIHAAGFRAGLWLAPFAVAERSGIPRARPEWLVLDAGGEPLVLDERVGWGGKTYSLDAAQVGVRDYLRDLVRHAVSEWGYDFLALDKLGYGTAGTRVDRVMSPAEAYRGAMRALREGAGRAFVLGCDAPLQQAAGLVDAMRVGPAVDGSFATIHPAAQAVALRAHFQRSTWLNDPGCLAVREPLTLEEARLWVTVVALSGALPLGCDLPGSLPPERLELLKRTLPVAPAQSRTFDLAAGESGGELFPAWLLARFRDDWWMLAALNWEEAARRFSFSLADHGIRGPLLAYDVWENRRRSDVEERVALELAPHSATVLALRRRRGAPCVIGSTRHVAQGMELLEERWDARRRALAARSVRLDGRPYAVTIALPPGVRPRQATTAPEAACTIETTGQGATRAARLTIPSPPGADVAWEVEF